MTEIYRFTAPQCLLYTLQYSCLENPMNGGAWQTTVHGVAKSPTRLSDFTYLLRNNKSTLILSISPTPKGKVNFMSCPNGNTTKIHLGEWRCPLPHSIRQVVHTVTDLKKSEGLELFLSQKFEILTSPLIILSFHHMRCEHWEGRHWGQEWRG